MNREKREEAIEKIRCLQKYSENNEYWWLRNFMEPFNMAIKALEQEPCNDAISRRAAIDAMYSLCGDGTLKENEWRDNPHIDSIIDALNDLPSVSTEKAGHWIERQHEAGPCWEYSMYECSECHVWAKDDSDYCPYCGAKMEVEE